MSLAEPGLVERNIDEIAASRAELSRLEPQVDEGVIEGLVQAAYDDLMPVKVHSFVTLLIVHEVRGILRSRSLAA
ncbi:MAG TPA: hypothetical protein VES93_03115 [Ornithinibacter sp.]|nr:hypothetical protein [Ornithinibacter sp.]